MITFILGVSAAVVVGILVWLVINNIKLNKQVKLHESTISNIWLDIENRYNSIERDRNEMQRVTDQRIDSLFSHTDSRFDKFANVIERNYVSKTDNASNTISYNN
jgi:hypothetical protein